MKNVLAGFPSQTFDSSKINIIYDHSQQKKFIISNTVRPPFRCNRAKEIFAPKKSAPKKSVGKYINEFYHETSLY